MTLFRRRIPKRRLPSWLLMMLSWLLLVGRIHSTASARPAKASPTANHPLYGRSTRQKQRLARTLQSWMIHHKAKPKSRMVTTNNKATATTDTRGSMLTFSKPTKERFARWFGVDEDPNLMLKCMLKREFNHDSVGMTNPFLHVAANKKDELQLRVQKDDTVVQVSTKTAKKLDDHALSCWWPNLSFPPRQKKEWRVLTYRKRVGTGVDCYKRVRDAALDWEFQTEDGMMGLLSVPTSLPNYQPKKTSQQQQRKLPQIHVARGRYTVAPIDEDEIEEESIPFHRSIGSSRRLVSFSASRLFPFLPKIYAVNPVMVVYDLVDQRGPGTTFSSTAYATMKGHLLRGEERVTVALRDGTQEVDVEIVSISKPGPSFKAKGIWPFIGKMQNAFFEQQLEFLELKAGRSNTIIQQSNPQHNAATTGGTPNRRSLNQRNNPASLGEVTPLVVDF